MSASQVLPIVLDHFGPKWRFTRP